jgi:hypothetical protein
MERTISLLPANAVTWLAAVRRTVRQLVLALSGEEKGTPLPPSIPWQSDRLVEERFDKRNYRKALGQFATGVTVITTRAIDERSVGLTANSFSSVSLDPPLVLWSLSRQSSSLADFIGASHFAIHVLAADQHYLSRRFSTSHPDRFSGVDYAQGTAGIPLLNGAIACIVLPQRAAIRCTRPRHPYRRGGKIRSPRGQSARLPLRRIPGRNAPCRIH